MSVATPYYAAGYYLSLFFFGAFGLALNVVSLLLAWVPDSPRSERVFQRVIHGHFVLFVWWMSVARLCRIRYRGTEPSRTHGGLVIVANHPGMLDVTYLLARLPEAICIFKPAIRRNPVLGAAARRAGYLASDRGLDLVRLAAEKVSVGHRLIVFPEGTRTPAGGPPLPFKPGFAVIAKRARVPIQLVRITFDSDALTKSHVWWKPPQLPMAVEVEFGPRLDSGGAEKAAELAQQAAAWFQTSTTAIRGDEPDAGLAAGSAGC